MAMLEGLKYKARSRHPPLEPFESFEPFEPANPR